MEKAIQVLARHSPAFRLKASNVSLLGSPEEFYETILNGINGAKSRIILASLYLGSGDKEIRLVETLENRLKASLNSDSNPELSVNILLDYWRGSRGSPSSFELLTPLAAKFPDRCSFAFLKHPKTQGLFASLLPAKAKEVCGVMHMKFFVFDDQVLLSGANMGTSYFENRVDRYILMRDKDLANYYEAVFEAAQRLSHTFDASGGLNPIGPPANFVRLQSAFAARSESSLDLNTEDVLIFPTNSHLYSGDDFMNSFRDFCTEMNDTPESATLMSPYLNIEDEMMRYLKLYLNKTPAKILTSSVTTNGFYGAKGPSGLIPFLYQSLSRKFLKKTNRPALVSDCNNREFVYEFDKKGHTFHAKGIQFKYKKFICAFFGSSNFGKRSASRDIENQVCILTSNQTLLSQFDLESDRLMAESSKLSSGGPSSFKEKLCDFLSLFVKQFL